MHLHDNLRCSGSRGLLCISTGPNTGNPDSAYSLYNHSLTMQGTWPPILNGDHELYLSQPCGSTIVQLGAGDLQNHKLQKSCLFTACTAE